MGNFKVEMVFFNPDYALELRNEAFSCDKM